MSKPPFPPMTPGQAKNAAKLAGIVPSSPITKTGLPQRPIPAIKPPGGVFKKAE